MQKHLFSLVETNDKEIWEYGGKFVQEKTSHTVSGQLALLATQLS